MTKSLLKIIAKKMRGSPSRNFESKSTMAQIKELNGRMKQFDRRANKTKEGYEVLIRAGLKQSGDNEKTLKRTYASDRD